MSSLAPSSPAFASMARRRSAPEPHPAPCLAQPKVCPTVSSMSTNATVEMSVSIGVAAASRASSSAATASSWRT